MAVAGPKAGPSPTPSSPSPWERRVRVLCGRELQVSIADSVHRLLIDRINARGLDPFFQWTNTGITSVTGSEFLFKGLRHNISEIKSLEKASTSVGSKRLKR